MASGGLAAKVERALDPAELRARLEARVGARLAPLLWALAAAFLFFAAITLVFRPPGATLALTLIDGGGALVLGATALLVGRRDAGPRANAVAAGALLLTLGASLAAIKLLHLPAQTTNVLLVQLVGSIVLLSALWTGLVLAASLVGWGAVAWSEGLDEAWLNAGFALVATSIMSVMVQWTRLRDARRAEELRASNEQKTRELEAFSYLVAHDLKEPVRGLSVLLAEARDSEDAQDKEAFLARAIVSRDQIEKLIAGLLEWSHATRAPLEPETLDVRALLDEPETRLMFERALQEHRARLLIESSFPPVRATAPLLRQALGNLVLNAVKHSDKPAPEVHVYAARDAPRGFVDLVVEDNGPGFSAAFLAEASSQAERPRSLKSGFGLIIARRVVERLGGTLVLRNRERGGGAEIHVLLPASRERAARGIGAARAGNLEPAKK